MKNQEEQRPEATEIDYLNAEWGNDMITAKSKLAHAFVEISKLKNVIDKQKAVIQSYKDKEKIS